MPKIDNKKVFGGISKRLKRFPKKFAEEFKGRLVIRTPNPPSLRADGTGPSTGNLKASWKYKITARTITFTNDAAYASYVEHGTPFMQGAHMLAATISESKRIAQRVITKLGG